MPEDNYQGDPRVAQPIEATPEQRAALAQRYQPKPPTAAGAAAQAKPAARPKLDATDPAALGAKTLQSATFGFGADAAGAILGKQAAHSIRELSNAYDDQHPLAAFGIDLAVAGATSLIPVYGEANDAKVAATGAKLIAQRAGTGAAVGGLTGVGEGGDAGARTRQGVEGAGVGTLAALGLGAAGKLVQPILDRAGQFGLSQAKAAADQIKMALAKDGKTVDQLNSFLRQNPNARIADFSDKVAELVGKVGAQSNSRAQQLGTNLRADAEGQTKRLFDPSQPLLAVKQQMIDNVKTLQKGMDKAYDKSRNEEVVQVTPEMQKVFDNPAVKPLLEKVAGEAQAAKSAGRLNRLPAFQQGQEVPTYALDELQRAIGQAAKDEGTGSGHYGTLMKLQQDLTATMSPLAKQARALAAKIGGESSETGLLGAQQWGHGFAFGLKGADIEKWRGMNPLQKEYARLGMVDGMEKYLRDHTRMTEGALNKIADRMNDPMIREVLGDRGANQMKKAFATEAARSRTSSTMLQGGSRQAAFQEENTERMMAHMANVGVPGAHSVVGTGLRILKSMGMPEARAQGIIDIATKPGGLQRLQAAGVDRRTLDVLKGIVKQKGAIPARLAVQQTQKGERRSDD